MLTNGIVSIVSYDKNEDKDILVGTYSAWIRFQDKTEKTENGRKKAYTLSVRIPKPNIPVKAGDYISPCELKKPDIKGLYFITEVKRNNFGGSPHIHIEAELS